MNRIFVQCTPSLIVFASYLIVFASQAIETRAQGPWSDYFQRETAVAAKATSADLKSITKESWPAQQAAWRTELREMLGLEPMPERTDLKVTVTGTIHHTGLNIQRLHYQSRPGLYVGANLYLPEGEAPQPGWPAVLYVCGHARVEDNGRILGNKTGYHHHGLWFARHGVACLIIDTVQLGELHGEHHGTYKLGRWDWVSRGYTPAGVEAWNAIRGIDVLESWPGIDGTRIGITGRSGGGAYSWFAAALDDRIDVAVPVAGITDLQNHIVDDCVGGHCDCMYFVNYYGWDYTKLAALVAPRPLLLANSDKDTIFPLDGVMRTHLALSAVYKQLDATENYAVLITPGPHQDTQELQVGAFKWLLRNLLGTEPVIDRAALKELTPAQLAVFDNETPADEQVTSAGNWFVPTPATVADPAAAAQAWRESWFAALQKNALRLPLKMLDDKLSFATTAEGANWKVYRSEPVDGLQASLVVIAGTDANTVVHLGEIDEVPMTAEGISTFIAGQEFQALVATAPSATHCFVQGRGAGWQSTMPALKDRIQTVRRFYLLGQMPEQLELADTLTALRMLHSSRSVKQGAEAETTDSELTGKLTLSGRGRHAALATLAALTCKVSEHDSLPPIEKLIVANYPHDPEVAPSLPGLLRQVNYTSLLAAARGSLEVIDQSSATEYPLRLVDSGDEPQQATGLRIVEVSQDNATVWLRATRWSLPNLGDMPELAFEKPAKEGTKNQGPILPATGVDGLQFAAPGVAAEVRVGHKQASRGEWKYSDWVVVGAETDYSALIKLDGLTAGTQYEVRTQVRGVGKTAMASSTGKFKTLPELSAAPDFRLAVGTCQDFPDRDGSHGFDLYRTMIKRGTDSFVMAGDVVYYDKLARSVPLANYHWQQTYGLPTLINFHRQVPTYFLKDDHDTYVNDSWPGMELRWTEDFKFEDGQRIFRQQTGLPSPAYRTLQIGKHLQVWMMEGRDFRSPNNLPDSADKSIWGAEQKGWLEQSLKESTATFRVVISPTPIVGPDRANKHDNHANDVFATEGNEVRSLLASYPKLVVVCGDRHWQYHSIDPKTGLHEFSVGPASDRHAGGWDAKEFREGVHQYLRVAGGYLEVELSGGEQAPSVTLRHLDTAGNEHHSHTLK